MALVLTFVKYIITNYFYICFCVKSILIKFLRTMVLNPCALCLSMDRWTRRGHDMIFGPIWAMIFSVIQVVFLGKAPCTKENLSNFR